MAEDTSKRGADGGSPGRAEAAGAETGARVRLPPFGLAQEILRQMSTPEELPSGGQTAGSDRTGAAQQTPAPLPVGSYRGRESLLQFAEAVMSVPTSEGAPPTVESEEHLVTFFLQGEEFGVPVLRSREIVRVGEITRIPEAPAHIRGVFNLRGRILPIVDLRTRLGLPPPEITPRSRLILVDLQSRQLALLVDSVSRMARVPASAVRPPPSEAISAQVDYVTGVAQVGGRLIILLDLDKVLLLQPEVSRQDPGP